MEIMIQWFWMLKLAFALSLGYSIYKLIKSKFKSKAWMVITLISALFMIMSPIKLDINTKQSTDRSNLHIKEIKVLPLRVSNDSFKQSANVIGITKEDLK